MGDIADPGSLWERADEAARFVTERLDLGDTPPDAALVLGSGLGHLAGKVQGAREVPYEAIPHFPRSRVAGHGNRLVGGRLGRRSVLVFEGRLHWYEGYPMVDVTFGVRMIQRLGVSTLILTNAAGGLAPSLDAGDLLLITDHINLIPDTPLRGPNEERFGPRFPSPVGVYDRRLIEVARRVAQRAGFSCQEGVYAAMPGPAYETEAEVTWLKSIGASAVGMSTVPEALVAAHGGQRVLAVSTITNVLGRQSGQVVTHAEVLDVAERVKGNVEALMTGILTEDW